MSTDVPMSEVRIARFDLSFSLLSFEWWGGMWFDFEILRIGDRSLISIYYPFGQDGYIDVDVLFFHVYSQAR